MPKNKLKWKKLGREDGDRIRAECGIFGIEIDWDADGGWLYEIEVSCYTVRSHEDYVQGFSTQDKAKSAAESWLSRQVEKMRKDLKGGGK